MFNFLSIYFRIAVFMALIPALVLMFIIYKQDKIESEPPSLLVKLSLLGGAMVVPAAFIETVFTGLLSIFVPDSYDFVYLYIENFIIIAIAEEGLKFLVLYLATWNDKNFNYRFDAVVYAVFVSLGFAAAENIMYVLNLGIGIVPIRALTAIPIHCICGIFMGHNYALAKSCVRWNMDLRKIAYLLLGVFIPVLIHGFYDFRVSTYAGRLKLLFILFVLVLDFVAIKSVRSYAENDTKI